MISSSVRLAVVFIWWLLCSCAIFPLASGQRATPLSTSDIQQLWASTFDGPRAASLSHTHSVAVDPIDGSVVMAGSASGTYLGHTSLGDLDAFVMKLSPTGSIVWVRWYATLLLDTAIAVSIDLNGNIYVTGYTYGLLPGVNGVTIHSGYSDVFVASLTTNGDPRWVRQFGTAGSNYGADIGVDIYGFAYVAWSSNMYSTGLPNSLTKLSPNGSTVFTQTYGVSNFFLDNSVQLAAQRGLVVVNPIANLTNNVSVVLAMMTSSASTYPYANFSNGGSYDVIVARVSASTGVPIWSRVYQTNTSDLVGDVAVDSAGMIWLAGTTSAGMEGGTYVGATNTNGFLSKLSFDGRKLLTVQYGAGTENVYATTVAVDNAGGVYVGGVNEQRTAQLMLDGQPTLYGVAATGPNNTTNPAILSKYDSDGFRLWTAPIDTYVPARVVDSFAYPGMRPTHIAFDTFSGQLYIVGDRTGLYTSDIDPVPRLDDGDYGYPQSFIIAAQQTQDNVSFPQYRALIDRLDELLKETRT